MEITFLGTAAAEGWPAVFCACDTCKRARSAGGKDIRSRASVQFGPKVKFDFPPDTWFHEAHLGADLSQLEHLFISHSHGDHWTPHELVYLTPPFAHNNPAVVNVYGDEAVVRTGLASVGGRTNLPVIFHEAEPFAPINAGEMIVTPIIASHMADEQCLNYVVQSHGKTVLCAWDSGTYENEKTWEYVESLRLDCAIVECTCGPSKCERYHMDFEHHLAFKDRLTKAGVISSDSVFVATHFSHNVGLLHEELEHVLNPYGIQVAYDGMKIIL